MSPDSVVRVPDYVLHQKVGDEMVLLQLDSGIYFGLDSVGTRLWELFTSGKTVAEVLDAMEAEYDVTRDQLQKDIEKLLDELGRQKLLFLE